ncbi:GAF domain-containing protein [bacterium]|nr:GAF domain-containing protein [bacterium]
MLMKTAVGRLTYLRLSKFVHFLLLLLAPLSVNTQTHQETGRPLITSYRSSEVGVNAQSWAFVQDDRGVMYIGTSPGVMEFDGAYWRTIPVANKSFARSLAIDDNQRIYVGASADFGYLTPNSLGELVYVSLLPYVKETDRGFDYVWTTIVTPQGIYFQTHERIFRFSSPTGGIPTSVELAGLAGKNDPWQVKVWKPQGDFGYAFWHDGTYFVQQIGVGLMKMVGDSLQFLPGGEQFANDRLQVMLPFDRAGQPDGPKKYLIGTFTRGFFLFDGQSFRPFRTEIDDFLHNSTLYDATTLPDGRYALATITGGCVLIDRQGNALQYLNTNVGTPSNSILSVFADRQGTVWLAPEGGITLMETPSPLSMFDAASGLHGGVYSIVRHKGVLYVGGANGIFYLDAESKSFKQVTGLEAGNPQTFALLPVGGELLAAVSTGLYRVEGTRVKVLRKSVGLNFTPGWLHRSRADSNRVFIALFDGLSSMRRSSDGWIFESRIPGIADYIVNIVENEPGELWLGSSANGVYKVKFPGPSLENPQIYHFNSQHGLPNDGGVLVFWAADRMGFITSEGVYRLQSDQEGYEPDTLYNAVSFGGNTVGLGVQEDHKGNIWASFGQETAMLQPQGDGSYQVEKTAFARFADIPIFYVYPEKDDVVWFGGTESLFRSDPGITKDYSQDYSALIRRVTVGEDSLIYGGARGNGGQRHASLAYRNNALRFEYAATSYANPEQTQYRSILEGFDDHWSNWGKESSRNYTNLPFGEYRFRVRARNIYQHESREASFAVNILPPWWRTWWAYSFYGALFVSLLFAGDRFQRRRLIKKERQQAQLREAKLQAQEAEARSKAAEAEAQALQAENERKKNIELLSEIGREITATLSMDAIFDRLYEHVNQLADATIFGVGLYHPEKQQIEYRLAITRGKKYKPYTRDMSDKNQFPVWCIENKKPVFINDVTREFSQYIEKFKELELNLEDGTAMTDEPLSLIYLPLIAQDRVLGVITIQSFQKNAYSEHHFNILQNLATYTTVALENARLFQETGQRAAELTTVNKISQAVSTKLELEALTELVGEQIRETFAAQMAYVAIYEPAAGLIHFPYDYDSGERLHGGTIRFGQGLTSKIIESGKPLLINRDVAGTQTELGVEQIGTKAKSYLGVPISLGGEVIGVLSVQSSEQEHCFDESDQKLLSTIAANVGVAIHNARLFEEAEQARASAEEANEAKSAFLSTVSHELRTPLTSVLGFAKIVKKRLEDRVFPQVRSDNGKTERAMQQVSENLEVVVSEGERLTTLINNVLDLAKIEAGKIEWNMENVAVSKIIARAATATSALFDAKPLKLVQDIEPDLPHVIGDEDKLMQVVINLISNAVKFTERGSVTCRAGQRDGEIVVSVIDTGAGIGDDDLPRVFEKFRQVGDTLTDKPQGTGLGLPICKEIVERHGGRIWAQSQVGQGSTFAFALPLQEKSEKEIKTIDFDNLVQRLKAQVVNSAPMTNEHEPTILVVDDEAHIRSLLKQELGEAGYAVQVVENGREALAHIRKQRPDLVILDVMMPEMNGFDVAAVLKNDPDTMDIPIIILSIVQDKERGYRLGVDRYLTKPIDTDALFKEISGLLAQGKSKKHVLVVDENASTVKTLADVLEARGYSVVEANGKELMEKAISEKPDIILMNALVSEKLDAVKSLRFEKGLENVFFLLFQ